MANSFRTPKEMSCFDPTVVNSKILDLTKEKINLQNQFILANSVQVIEGFTAFETPSKPKLSISLVAGAWNRISFCCIYHCI